MFHNNNNKCKNEEWYFYSVLMNYGWKKKEKDSYYFKNKKTIMKGSYKIWYWMGKLVNELWKTIYCWKVLVSSIFVYLLSVGKQQNKSKVKIYIIE